MRFSEGAVVLTRDEVVALLAFTDKTHRDVFIERRNCDTGIGRAVAIYRHAMLVLEPPGTETFDGTWSGAKPSSYCIPAEHLRLWLRKLPEVTPLNEALAIGCALSTTKSKQVPNLSATVVNYEELLLGRTVTLHTFDPVLASTQKFEHYEKHIPRRSASSENSMAGPTWLDPDLFTKLTLVQAAVSEGDRRSVRLQLGPIKIEDGEALGSPIRFDFAYDAGKTMRCWGHGAIAACGLNLEADYKRPEDK